MQGTARDLLAAAIERFEARGIPIVLTVHDECVAEVPAGSITEAEFLAILLEPPAWAAGLPLAGKVWSGTHYLEPPEEHAAAATGRRERTRRASSIETEPDKLIDALIADIPPPPLRRRGTPRNVLAELDDDVAPLFDLVSVPLTDDRKTQCPFHADDTPSLQFYADHFHCFGCGEHGDRIDWLTRGEGLTREEAIALIQDWDGPAPRPQPTEEQQDRARARTVGRRAFRSPAPSPSATSPRPAASTSPGCRRTSATACASSPAARSERDRFGPACSRSCATRRATNRLESSASRLSSEKGKVCKLDRFALGRIGAIKLWPAGAQLVVGEGLETTLAAATRIPYRGAPLQPAWSAVSSGGLSRFPVLPGVERLIILVDHDGNGEGQAAAVRCMERWTRAGRTVIRLTPKRVDADFNDLVLPEPVS